MPTPTTVTEQMIAGDARDITRRIQNTIGDIGENLDDLATLVTKAFEGKAWAAMGFPSWEAYTEASFGTRLRGLAKADRGALIGAMHGGSMSTRAIAKAVGASARTVGREIAARPSGAANAAPERSASSPDTSASTGRVTGADGKTYPAQQPRPAPAPAEPAGHVAPGVDDPPAEGDAGDPTPIPDNVTPIDVRAREPGTRNTEPRTAAAPSDVAPLQAEIGRLTAEVARLKARAEPMPVEARPCTRCSGKGWLTKAHAAPAKRGGKALISPKDCAHPVNSRIGDDCMVCGSTVTRKAGK